MIMDDIFLRLRLLFFTERLILSGRFYRPVILSFLLYLKRDVLTEDVGGWRVCSSCMCTRALSKHFSCAVSSTMLS